MPEIWVGMRGIVVEMWVIEEGMRGITVGMRKIEVGMR